MAAAARRVLSAAPDPARRRGSSTIIVRLPTSCTSTLQAVLRIPACGCLGAAGRPGKARSHGFIGIDVPRGNRRRRYRAS